MIDNRISDAEMLKYLLDNAMIDHAIVTQSIIEMKKKQFLEMHTYKVWLANDGYWKTKVKEGDNTYRLIKKKQKSDLENAIIEHYERLFLNDNTFKQRFSIWIERQRNCGRSENTILKYKSDYKRFFEGYPIENIDIRKVDDEVLSQHILKVLNEKKIRWRAFKDIMGYTSGVYDKAVRDKVIPENPFKYIDLPLFKKYCYIPPVKTTNQRILTEEDTHLLLDKLRNPKAHNTNRMCCFAIEMALYTGMRVGELAALMWEDIIFEEDLILIRHSEKFDRTTKESTISTTKTGKERIFPLTDDIKALLFKIRSYETDHGWLGEFVFQDSEGRLTKSKISDTTRNLTMSDEFTGIKSIHAIRRTFNSNLKCNGVSSTIASSLLGHTERVNEQNYTYDVSGLNDKMRIVTMSNLIRKAENG